MTNSQSHNWLFALLSFLGPFFLYAATTLSTVAAGDSGEFVTAACSLGVPHPPGFPVYVLIGKVFCSLPFGSAAYRMNLMSGFFGALTCLVLFLVLREWKLKPIVCLVAAWILATSKLFWMVSRTAEANTLHTFFVALIFWLCLRYRQEPGRWNGRLIFLFLGMSLASHGPLAILALPAFFVLLITPLRREGFYSLLRFFPWFFLGLTPYLLIPLFSMQDPAMDWGHPRTLTNFWIHLLRKTVSEQDPGYELINTFWLARYLSLEVLLKDFSWLGFPLAVLGILKFWTRLKIPLLASLVGWMVPNLAILAVVKIPWHGPWIEAVVVEFSAGSFFMAIWIALGIGFLLGCMEQKRDPTARPS